MSGLARALIAFASGGFVGWLGETVVNDEPRYSHFFGKDQKIPFLPIYGFGAAAVATAAPHLQQYPWYVRGAIYSAGLSAIEVLGCGIDRAQGDASWNYPSASTAAGCLSLPHAVLWGALGLAVDRLVE